MSRAKRKSSKKARPATKSKKVVIQTPGSVKQAEKTFGVNSKRSREIQRLVEEAVG